MSLIIVLLALLIERLAVFIHPMRSYRWFEHYAQKIAVMVKGRAYLSLPISLLPVLVIVFFIHLLLAQLTFGWAAWIFDLVVLVYCLGNTHLRTQAQECYEQVAQGNMESARTLLFEYFDVEESGDVTINVIMRAFYRASLQRVFAILFWFVILGPVGAVLYRLVHKLSIYSADETMVSTKILSNQAAFILDWIPARLLALSFCLAGNFMDVFTEWRATFQSKIKETYQVLYRCGHAAIGMEKDEQKLAALEPEMVKGQFDDAYYLVCRALFIWLVALALIILF